MDDLYKSLKDMETTLKEINSKYPFTAIAENFLHQKGKETFGQLTDNEFRELEQLAFNYTIQTKIQRGG